MRDLPSGSDLERLAHEIGGADALVGRCLAIAEREREAFETGFAACRAALAARYGEDPDGALLTRFAADIRAGAFDAAGEARDWALRVLRDVTRAKLRASNPEFLAANGFG